MQNMSETFPGFGHFVMKQCTPNFTRDKVKGFSWFFKIFYTEFESGTGPRPNWPEASSQKFCHQRIVYCILLAIVLHEVRRPHVDSQMMHPATPGWCIQLKVYE